MTRPPVRVGLLGALCALAVLGAARPASADVLYVAPDGTDSSAHGCTDRQEPCEIHYAIEQQSQPGDEVVVGPGDYSVLDLIIGPDRYVHGADHQPRPRLVFTDGDWVRVGAGTRLRHVALESPGPATLFLRGERAVGENLLVSSTGSAGADLGGTVNVDQGAVLRDSVVTARGDGTSAVLATDGQADIRNVTAIAAGPNSAGVQAACATYSGLHGPYNTIGAITAKNSIARGATADIWGTRCDGAPTGSTLSISYSNFRSGHVSDPDGTITTGVGNQTSVDPLFVDAAAGDFHQMPTSPTIDAGTRDPLLGKTDIDGQPRRLGLAPDIGADEAPARGRCVNAILGTAADDDLSGTAKGDRIRGLDGDDSLEGRAGADCLAGGRGKDKLVGGAGRNTYQAGRGNDRVVAANGKKESVDCGRGRNDTAVVDKNDVVTQCEHVRRADVLHDARAHRDAVASLLAG